METYREYAGNSSNVCNKSVYEKPNQTTTNSPQIRKRNFVLTVKYGRGLPGRPQTDRITFCTRSPGKLLNLQHPAHWCRQKHPEDGGMPELVADKLRFH